ncbi:hypothetical protein C6495_14790 [Candidatus Poribacteria bacterium]|nr:MAG: hypothetical protein C6495_14790 [Candidatus Poribacteria bacterium]
MATLPELRVKADNYSRPKPESGTLVRLKRLVFSVKPLLPVQLSRNHVQTPQHSNGIRYHAAFQHVR